MDFKFLLLGQLVAPAIGVALVAPVVLYLLARWRASKEPAPDPQLGIKFVLYYFSTIALHIALAGLTLLIYAMIKPSTEDGEPKGQLYRMAFGFLIPAGLVLAAHVVMLLRTNDTHVLGVRRLFAGFNLMLTGLLGFGALILGFQALFAKGSTDGMGHFGGAAILVYCSAWGVIAWRFGSMTIGGGGANMEPMPEIMPPPGAPPGYSPPPQQASGGGGLPSLGGGSFPPIGR